VVGSIGETAGRFGFLRNGINFGSDGGENHKKKHIQPGAIYTEVCAKLPCMPSLIATKGNRKCKLITLILRLEVAWQCALGTVTAEIGLI
jgi:hypothetical protein